MSTSKEKAEEIAKGIEEALNSMTAQINALKIRLSEIENSLQRND